MEDKTRICPFCKKEIYPGDQVCIHCGQKIPNVSLNVSDLTNQTSLEDKKKSKFFSVQLMAILFCTFLIILGIVITYFFFLKR